MNQKLFNVFVFAAGATVGSLVTWRVLKTKYEREMQEEIDVFKKDYAECMRNESEDEEFEEDEFDQDDQDWFDGDEDDSDITAYHGLAHMYNQSGEDAENDREGAGDEEDDEVPYINGPYVIMPEDFADGNYNHSPCSLTYYSDGILADDWLVQMDIEETIGEDSLDHIGDYAEDVVHVRNERTERDYEVVRDPRRYADVLASNPLAQDYAT